MKTWKIGYVDWTPPYLVVWIPEGKIQTVQAANEGEAVHKAHELYPLLEKIIVEEISK